MAEKLYFQLVMNSPALKISTNPKGVGCSDLGSIERGAELQSVIRDGNTVCIAKGEPESLVVEVTCSGELLAGFLFNALNHVNNPLRKFETLLSDRELNNEVIERILVRTPLGSIESMFDGAAPALPTSPRHVIRPSMHRHAVTGLPLASGFIQALDNSQFEGHHVLTVGMIDVGMLGATNKIVGPEFADILLKKIGGIAEQLGIDLYQPGGDEFSFTMLGASAEANHQCLNQLRDLFLAERDTHLATLPEDQLAALYAECEAKRVQKGRAHSTEPLDLYLSSQTVSVSEATRLFESVDRGVVLLQMLGISDHAIYAMKDSAERVHHCLIAHLAPPRLADCEAVAHVRNIDQRAEELIQRFKTPNLTRFENIALHLNLALICAEDPSLDHGILRDGRLDQQINPRSTLREVIFQFMNPESTGKYLIDLSPFGEVNTSVGGARADKIFGGTVIKVYSLGNSLLVRTSGGGVTLYLPSGGLSESEEKLLHDKLLLAFQMRIRESERDGEFKFTPQVSLTKAA